MQSFLFFWSYIHTHHHLNMRSLQPMGIISKYYDHSYLRNHPRKTDLRRRSHGTSPRRPCCLCSIWAARRTDTRAFNPAKTNFARGELIEIIKASPDRIDPKCRHFTQCGGCHYQNLSYKKQLSVKTDILRDQLQRIGKIENPPVKPIVASPLEWNYRNHMQFHLTEDGKPGFITSKGNSTFPIEECHLPETGINGFWRELQFESRMNLERVSVRSGQDEELMLVLESDARNSRA